MPKSYGYNPKELNLNVKGYSGNSEVIVMCPNPTHNDHNPSACFNTISGLLFCFSCGYSCNIHQLCALQGVTVEKSEIEYEKPDSEQLWKEFDKAPVAYRNPYLFSRDCGDMTIGAFDIREIKQGVVFLFRNTKDKLVGCQIRQYTKQPKYLTFGERTLFDLRKLKNVYNPDKPIYLTEGVFGMIHGYHHNHQTLATIGAMINRKSLELLSNWRKVYGVFDDDLAGVQAGIKLLDYLPQAKVVLGFTADTDNWDELPKYQTTGDVTILKNILKTKTIERKFHFE